MRIGNANPEWTLERRSRKMAKFYVKSGTLRIVVQADDARTAALWAVHKTMQQVLPMYDDDLLSPQEKHARAVARGFMVLGETLELSEIGFGRYEAHMFETCNVVTEWSKLLVALTRLEKELVGV